VTSSSAVVSTVPTLYTLRMFRSRKNAFSGGIAAHLNQERGEHVHELTAARARMRPAVVGDPKLIVADELWVTPDGGNKYPEHTECLRDSTRSARAAIVGIHCRFGRGDANVDCQEELTSGASCGVLRGSDYGKKSSGSAPTKLHRRSSLQPAERTANQINGPMAT
jgi:hypothetical protein